MANDWKSFIVTTKYVTDLQGVEYSYSIPPSWKTELLIWEILEQAPQVNVESIESALEAFEVICDVVTFVINFPRHQNIEESFDSEGIETVFTDVWQSVVDSSVKELAQAPSTTPPSDFSLAQALAMFATECGWTPEQVLSLPKVQVLSLTTSISDYVTQRLKFQAAIHGVPLEGDGEGPHSASSGDSAQIDIESQMMQFKAAGLPIEVI